MKASASNRTIATIGIDALGTMFIAHSMIYMLMTLTLDGTAKFFVSIGLPAWLAYATVLAEATRKRSTP